MQPWDGQPEAPGAEQVPLGLPVVREEELDPGQARQEEAQPYREELDPGKARQKEAEPCMEELDPGQEEAQPNSEEVRRPTREEVSRQGKEDYISGHRDKRCHQQ